MKTPRFPTLLTIALALIFPSLAFPSLAEAETIEVKSKNITFVGDTSGEEAKRLVTIWKFTEIR